MDCKKHRMGAMPSPAPPTAILQQISPGQHPELLPYSRMAVEMGTSRNEKSKTGRSLAKQQRGQRAAVVSTQQGWQQRCLYCQITYGNDTFKEFKEPDKFSQSYAL
ncbi:hypothetical protein EK904_012350 [Melospiza melodia maxima]|nr:hypothetical protein EK904_012350 [Melospiza melodia maxima]